MRTNWFVHQRQVVVVQQAVIVLVIFLFKIYFLHGELSLDTNNSSFA